MKITFIYTAKPNLTEVPVGERVSSRSEVPDTTKDIPGINAYLVSLGMQIARFSNAYVHIHCPDVGLKLHPLFQEGAAPKTSVMFYNFSNALVLYFEETPKERRRTWKKCALTVHVPLTPQFLPISKKSTQKYFRLSNQWSSPEQIEFVNEVRVISDTLI